MNPYESFAPIRLNQRCKWFSNAADYMRCVHDAILNASEEIFITDWWLSPEIYLRRPIEHVEERLDKVLARKSTEGVHVYVLIYNEFGRFLNLNSLRTEQILTDYGKNKFIHVIRHPGMHFNADEILWTHHEKCVIVDQTMAFMGGIDLCFGRWDDHVYNIVDLGIKAKDLCDEKEDDDFVVIEKCDFEQQRPSKGMIADIVMGRYVQRAGVEAELVAGKPVNENKYVWLGKDYANTFRQDFRNVDRFEEDQFDRTKVPRMPWRDHGLVMFGECVQDLAAHFKTRWEHAKGVNIVLKNSKTILPDWFTQNSYSADIQLLRSLDYWSGGLKHCEASIMNAYFDLITNAEHYVYIENQYFVTTCSPDADTDVHNPVGQAIVNRIKRAFNEKRKFRVFVVLPLLPGFDNIEAIRAVQFYNLRSINRGDLSIYKQLLGAGIRDPSEYITFHCMKSWSMLKGKPVSETIYVHSKLMIVDDKHVICGSANINDRSLLGSRDSELAALIADKEFTGAKFDNADVQVGRYAHELRIKMFRVLLGLSDTDDVTDCVCDEFYSVFKQASARNTNAYSQVFKNEPSNNTLTLSELKSYFSSPYEMKDKINPENAKSILENEIRGFIIDFPLKFLLNEKHFYPEWDTIDGLVPKIVWTCV